MAQQSTFREVLVFLDKLGVYDVILPFLLVFTIFFAILEKTQILGTEKVNGEQVTRKNINSIVAFCVSFLVIASTKLVAVISETMAHVVLLLILGFSFMLLVGIFYGTGEFTLKEHPAWISFFMILMFIGVSLILINALGWFSYVIALFKNWDAEWAASIIMFAIIIGFMVYVTWDKQDSTKKSD